MSGLLNQIKRVIILATFILFAHDSNWASGTEPPNGLAGTVGESDGPASFVPSIGSMTYAIPFLLPANRGTAQPDIALKYSSNGRTGEAGLGWSLNLPSIERAPLSGWPKYLDNGVPADEDRFTYDGRPLTFICVVGGLPACPRNDRVGDMPSWANGYRHYRLQVNGSFERFFWSPGHSRWIVQRQGGEILEFGYALTRPDLQLASPYDRDVTSGRDYRWYLAVQRDLHGTKNIIYYRWASDGLGARKYLRDIYYAPPAVGGENAALSAFAYHVELSWENPPYRQQDFTYADKRPHYKRLRRVAVSAMPWSRMSNREFVRAYNLTYFPERGESLVDGEAPLWGRSSLKSFQTEGRCATSVEEISGRLPDPTGCETLPAQTFEYQPAKLAFGTTAYTPIDAPNTTGILSYPTSSALIDINRDGLPDIVQAWPTNYDTRSYHVHYPGCDDGEGQNWAISIDHLSRDPLLICHLHGIGSDDQIIRSAREQRAWINRGILSSAGGLNLMLHCLDAGGIGPGTLTHYQITGAVGFVGRDPSLFTQYGAEAIGEWGNGSMLWSLAGYHAFGFEKVTRQQPLKPGEKEEPLKPGEYDRESFLQFCPEGAIYTLQPALRWVKTGSPHAWAKDPVGTDAPESRYYNMVDIDGDGYTDLLLDRLPGEIGIFKRADIRFTRKISALEQPDGIPGPALFPFVTSNPNDVTITPYLADYSAYADINGDGIVDLITNARFAADKTPEVRLGNGRGGFGCDPVSDIACQIAGQDWLGRAYRLFTPGFITPWPLKSDHPYAGIDLLTGNAAPVHFFHDVTGDGLADIIEYTSGPVGRLRLWVNVDGRTFRCANSADCTVATMGEGGQPSPAMVGPNHRIVFTDIDGNGTEDFVLIAFKGMWTFSFLQAPGAGVGPSSPRAGLLTRIRNGMGADTEITYRTIQDLDQAASNPNPDSFQRSWSTHVPQVIPVVTQITTRDTPSVMGTPLVEPYTLNRTQRFEFRDPAYDLWERNFKGFNQIRSIMPNGEVTQTWYYFGACEAGPIIHLGCQDGSDGSNDGRGSSSYLDKPLVGSVARVDRFIAGGGAHPDKWLSTVTNTYDIAFNWIEPAGTNPDRPVTLGLVARVDTYLYDTEMAVTRVNDIQRPTQPQFVPWQAARVHLRSDTAYDNAGNVKTMTQYGRVEEGSPNYNLDTVITTTFLPATGRCKANWACSTLGSEVVEQLVGATGKKRLRHTVTDRNDTEDVIASWGELFYDSVQVAGLDRDLALGTRAPSVAQTPGLKKVREFEIDEVGNVTTVKGEPGPNQLCIKMGFDASFKQFPESVHRYAGGSCNGLELSTEYSFDRGLGAPTAARMRKKGTSQSVEFDPFGRVVKVFAPVPDRGPNATELALQITHHTQSPSSWMEVRRRVDKDEFITSIEIFNGVGEHVLGFDEADRAADGAPWILRNWTQRDSEGQVDTLFQPWFFAGEPYTLATYATSPSIPTSLLTSPQRIYRDSFGRVTSTYDGSVITAEYTYLPLEVRSKDAEQRKSSGPYAGGQSTIKLDGHGRTIESVVPTDRDSTITRMTYLGTGEPTHIERSGKSSSAPSYTRSMEWDSFGRLIHNWEPNTSHVEMVGGATSFRGWHYVYDNEGRLVGTSDARRCGNNLHYDALGRLLAEDFSPCLAAQPAYTTPNLTTGDGTEAFYRYDTYEAGQVEASVEFDDRRELALGHLVSIQDRGTHTRINYDARGRTRRVMKRIARPGLPTELLAERYAAHWFKQEQQFDLGNRIRTRTTGLEYSEFTRGGGSFETMSYSTRGMLREVGSSYGAIVSALTYSANGQPLKVTHGDRAATTEQMSYDPRNFLRTLRVSRMTSPSLWTDPPRPGYSLPNNETTQLTLSDLVFIHDDVGNPTAITDISTDYWPVGSKPVSRTFQYDSAYRITEAEYMHSADMHEAAFDAEARSKDRSPVAEVVGANRVEKQTFRNDWQGNTIFSDDNEKLRFDRSLGKISNGAGIDQEQRGPNQLIDAAGIHAEYDAAGNVVELTVARRICWDGMPECSHRFRYDWDEVDQLVQARRWDFPAGVVPDFDPNAVPVRDLRYVYGGGSRVLTSKTDGKTIARHKLDVFDTLRLVNVEYVPAYTDYNMKPENEVGFLGGVARVFYDAAGTLPRSGETPIHVFFNIVDHLGSSAFVIDKDSGEVVERTTYQAYGAVEADFRPSRWGAFRESFKFTGKEEDIEVGISYFGARYLNMRLGRWMSADPLTVHGLEGDLNPYAYVGGQVTNHIDPYGLSTCRDGTPDCQDVDVQGTPRKKDVDLHPVAEPMSQKDILRQMVNEQASHTPGGMLYKTIFTPIRDWLFPKRRKFLNAQQNVVESNAHQDHTDAVVALGKLAEIILQPLLPRPNVQPPGLEALSRAGKVIDTWDPVAKFLTRAGRALVKHQKGLRPGATKFSGVKGQPSAWNEAGQAHLDDILTNPASTTTTLGRGGLKVTAPDGRAARFNADGSFDGFVE